MKKRNKTRRKLLAVLTTIPLLASTFLGTIYPLKAQAVEVSTKTVVFDNNINPSQSKTITLPPFEQIKSVTVDKGNVDYSLNGKDITLNVSGGTPVGKQWNPTKYSKYATTTLDSNSPSFPTTTFYSDGTGYSGTLYQNIEDSYYTGSFTPSDTKYVTGQGSSYYSDANGYSGYLSSYVSGQTWIPSDTKYVTGQSSSSYSDANGYSGTLSKYVSGQTWHPSDTKYVTGQSSSSYSDANGYSGYLSSYVASQTWHPGDSKTVTGTHSSTFHCDWVSMSSTSVSWDPGHQWWEDGYPSTIYYDSGGYKGTLYWSYNTHSTCSDVIPHKIEPKYTHENPPRDGTAHYSGTVSQDGYYTNNYLYQGNVTKPGYYTDNYLYQGNVTKPGYYANNYLYQGNVTKPSVDTRHYYQGYAGTIYKGEYENLYGYTVTIQYLEDATPPTISLKYDDSQLSNKVKVDVSAYDSGSGIDKIVFPDGSFVYSSTGSYTITKNGTYVFTTYDKKGNQDSKTITLSNIDSEPPNPPTINGNSDWSNDDVTVTMNDNGDTGKAGVDRVEYLLSGATTKDWTTYDSPLTISNEGVTQVRARVVDKIGNISSESTISVKVDKTAPSIQTSVNPSSWTKDDATISISGTDSLSGIKEIQLPNGNIVNGSSANFTATGNGNFTFSVEDNVGNVTTKTVTISQIDKTSPSLVLTADKTNWTNTNVTISASASDNESGVDKIQLPTGTFVNGTTASSIVSSNGTYSFTAYDKAGNQTAKTMTINNIDKISPTIDIQADKTNWTNQDVVLTVKGTDGESGVNQIQLPNGSWVNNSQTTYTVASNGSYTFVVEDKAGNQKSQTFTVSIVDKTLPQLTYSLSPSVWTKGNVTISINATDDKSGVKQIKKPDGTIINGYSTTYTATDNGTYSFEITDQAGNKYTKDIVVSNIDRNAPISTFSLNPSTWTNGNVTITIQTIDNEGGVKRIILPNGTSVYGSGNSLSATYTATNNGTLEFTVEDSLGNSSIQQMVVENIDRELPVLSLSANKTAYTKDSVTITANASDSKSGIKRIQLPNGTWETSDMATFDVTANGSYNFKAEDNSGNTVTKSITVSNIDSTPPSTPTISNNQAWTKDTPVTVNITAGTDSQSGIKKTEYKLDGATSKGWTTYTGAILIENEGITQISARTIDNVDNISSEVSSSVKIDKSAPYNTGITINLKP